jgi:hypothetical protein
MIGEVPGALHGPAGADLLEEADGFRPRIDAELAPQLPQAGAVLAHRPVRLVETGVRAHQQLVDVLPAQVEGDEALACLDALDVGLVLERAEGDV